MEHLWAPWRVGYIRDLRKPAKGCVFCRIHRSKNDAKNYIFARTKHSFAVLNIYPYNNGHVLIVPNRHAKDLSKLSVEHKQDLWSLLETVQSLFDVTVQPHGYNVGINFGKIAGAGFPGHMHIHLVPRWKGDVNFMPVTANTKVVSQSLSAMYRILKNAYQKRHRKV